MYEQQEKYQLAYDYYSEAEYALNNNEKDVARQAIVNLTNRHQPLVKKQRLAVFVKKGLDSFIDDIIEQLNDAYIVKKMIVTTTEQIDKGMDWADICWFEWCDELVVYGSNNEKAIKKKVICRLHRYEVFTDYPLKVNWKNVDRLLIVSDHLKILLKQRISNIEQLTAITVLKNGVNLEKFQYKERTPGFNIAYVGYIHMRKNPVLLLQIMRRLVSINPRYTLYIAGEFQDSLAKMYWDHQVKELNLTNNIVFDGWQNDIDTWLEDKNYLLSTSIHESFGYGIAESMARGIKPIIHHFPFADEIWATEYLFSSIDEAVEKITRQSYSSPMYRSFIEQNYSLSEQINRLKTILNDVNKEDKTEFNYAQYWNSRLENKFDIEGVGYIGLGEIYNEWLYLSRMEILRKVMQKRFKDFEKVNVLEIGPGIGMFTKQFYQHGCKNYVGIDISTKSVSTLREQYQEYRFHCGDISDSANYPSDIKFDLIFGADVLLHITNERKYKQTIHNLSSCLSSGGIVLLFDPITLTDAKSGTSHVVIRSLDYIQEIFNEAGLDVGGYIPTNFYMNYPFDKKLLGQKMDLADAVFQQITDIYKRNHLDRVEQNQLGKAIYLLDKICLLKHGLGLSQKAVIAQKGKGSFSLNVDDIWSKENLEYEYRKAMESLESLNPALKKLLREIEKAFIL